MTVTRAHQASSGSASRDTSERKAAGAMPTGRDRRRRCLGFRLAGEWIGDRATRSPTRADDAVSSLQWMGTNSDAALLSVVDHDLQHA